MYLRNNLPFFGKPSNMMVDKTPPKVGLPYGVAQGYFIEKKKWKKRKRKRLVHKRGWEYSSLVPRVWLSSCPVAQHQLFVFFFFVKNIAWGDWESCLVNFDSWKRMFCKSQCSNMSGPFPYGTFQPQFHRYLQYYAFPN